jgi:hypothetical protein
MCFHQACWLLPNGDILWTPETDDHETLAAIFKIRDTQVFHDQRAVRVELKRPEDIVDFGDLKKWTMILDEPTRPDWVTDDMLAATREKLEAIVDRQFVRTNIGTVAGGCWIVLAGGRIEKLIGGRILAVQKGANLTCAYLTGANLTDANLTCANLAGANLTDANLTCANLARANLAGAYLTCANLARANLAGAYLTCANLADANLAGANLAGANLAGANLAGANLTGANLTDANLTDANLTCAYLTGAYLTCANLAGAYLTCANLADAYLLSSDPLPAGWVRHAETGLLSRAP